MNESSTEEKNDGARENVGASDGTAEEEGESVTTLPPPAASPSSPSFEGPSKLNDDSLVVGWVRLASTTN